jgi:N-acetyl-gamma-glutamyl-phosphate reductase
VLNMKAFVAGGSGYGGGELLRLLAGHPRVDEIASSSRTYEGKRISAVHPNLSGIVESEFKAHDPSHADADIVFLALPHGQSMEYAPQILECGMKVIDFSADYRMGDARLYGKHYGKHKNPELLEDAVYGLPELFRDDIRKSRLIANPGCYATAALLALKPLSSISKSLDFNHVIVDAKSGTSGAGAKPSQFLHHSEVFDNIRTYKETGHRHEPEIDHILDCFIKDASVSFTPTLMPVVRGIICNCHIFGDTDIETLRAAYSNDYRKEPFIRVVDAACTKNVLYSNYCDIQPAYDAGKGRAVIVSAIDNLVKGAAGQAMQNMNLLMGYPEDEGLKTPPYHP